MSPLPLCPQRCCVLRGADQCGCDAPTSGAVRALESEMQALDYFGDKRAAKAYVARRAADAAKVMRLLKWEEEPCVNGVLRAGLYGHSIWWDVTGTTYEILPNGADDFAQGNLQQVLAYILALNW